MKNLAFTVSESIDPFFAIVFAVVYILKRKRILNGLGRLDKGNTMPPVIRGGFIFIPFKIQNFSRV